MKMSSKVSANTNSMKRLLGTQGPDQRTYQKGSVHNFYVYDAIGEADDYVDLISTLDESGEDDTVNIFLNTPGGSLETTISIIHAIYRSDATVIAHADGEIISAGTLIFLACPMKIVYPYAIFMYHDGSMIVSGKMNESMKSIIATNRLVKRILGDIYYPYFSKEEIENILEGKDVWLDSEEMVERIQRGDEILNGEIESAMSEVEKEDKVEII